MTTPLQHQAELAFLLHFMSKDSTKKAVADYQIVIHQNISPLFINNNELLLTQTSHMKNISKSLCSNKQAQEKSTPPIEAEDGFSNASASCS